ncbi:MAG: RNA 2',3'-cyclic phosphodiesterase [Deinococcus sp.]
MSGADQPAGPKRGRLVRQGDGEGATRPALPGAAVQRPEPRLRLFFALRLPPEVGEELSRAQAQLRGNWRRVAPEQLHVTLAYLPGIPQGRVRSVEELGRRVCSGVAPLQLRLRGTGYRPNTGGPRVWFVKGEGDGLDELALALRCGLEGLGVTPEEPFRPHVTLARKKGPAPRVPPISFAREWVAPQVTLIHSTLRKTGPIYDTVNRFRLNGTPSGPPPASTPTTPLQDSPPEEQHG